MGAELRKITISDEMISAGVEALALHRDSMLTSENLVLAIFRAMVRSHEPRIHEASSRAASHGIADRYVA
jgi:hypothetical protein